MSALLERLSRHLRAPLRGERLDCPECAGDYGATMPPDDLDTFEDGYLPAAPLLVGVCLDCGYIYEPAAALHGEEENP